MLRVYKNFNLDKIHKRSILLIGNFDGLHLGHQKLFKLAKDYSNRFKTKIGVLTFNPLPAMFFNKNLKNYNLTNIEQKKILFSKIGVNFIIIKNFNKKFSKISYIKFIKNILKKKIDPKFIFVSDNFRFGFKRRGGIKELKNKEIDYKYKIIKPLPLKKNKQTISSTLIRKLLQSGKLKKANQLLNRKWEISGTVVKGKQLGKKLGFPTCNIELNNYIMAKPGVYSVKIQIKNFNKNLNGIANLGFRPTFGGKKILLEVNLFNFSGNLYNKSLNVSFHSFIRKEKKFKNREELIKQIGKDLKKAKFDLEKK